MTEQTDRSKDILMLIKTAGLEYDDRLRKEVLSLQKLGACVRIAALDDTNVASDKTVYGSTSASTIHLRSRSWFSRARGLWLKTLEMYLRFLLFVVRKKTEVLWVHNLEMFGLLPALILLRKIGVLKRLIWDQHELPSDAVLVNKLFMNIYCILVNNCDVIIMANEERRELISQKVKIVTPVYILHNYPDELFRQLPRNALPHSVVEWLQDTPYVLAQGGANLGRHIIELAGAVIQQSDIRLIVIGPYQRTLLDRLEQEYGIAWHNRLLFTGYVPQMEITPYIDHAITSIVFYTLNTENTRLCAPNRLYQALSRGTPVITGPNPPMLNILNKFGCGMVVDHNDPASIGRGIENVRKNREAFTECALDNSFQVSWEKQFPTVKLIIDA